MDDPTSKISFQYLMNVAPKDPFVVSGRLELPTSTLSV